MQKPLRKKRVLIIRAGMLGDTIWGTTPIDVVRASLGGDAEVDLVVKSGMGGLFRHDPRIAKIFEIRRRKLPLLLSATKLGIVLRSWRQRYDLAIDLETSRHFRGVMRLLRAARKVEGHRMRDELSDATEHAVVSLRRILAHCVSPALAQMARPSLIKPLGLDVRARYELQGDTICIHPGNSWLAAGRTAQRAWPLENWRTLLENWNEWFPQHRPVLIGQPAEASLANELTQGLPFVTNLCGKTNLPQLMAVLADSALLLSTDTGPAHMAAALGRPVVALFGPTDARQTAPFASGENRIQILSLALPCSPCVKTPLFDTCPRNACMADLSPRQVAQAMRAGLGKAVPIVAEPLPLSAVS